ncbi:MAG: methylated-DNA--[protein]-cysteine S-methyltransferase [Spirochaetes bacterium]|nr:methylated-DNA--[protein]-cysteine S-methyltransferase [Spirochaetota bacterium]
MYSSNSMQQSVDYKRIEKAIQYLESNFTSHPTLEEIAEHINLSKYHFNRLFKRWAGISPIQFQQFMTLDYTKQKLTNASSLLDAAFAAGLSAPSRLHDLFVTFDAMTPGEFKNHGEGVKIYYGFKWSPFGKYLIATTKRGICHLGFIAGDDCSNALNMLFETWPGADFNENLHAVNLVAEDIFTNNNKNPGPFHLYLKGTNFQINVWKALLRIPEGWVVSYKDVASYIGQPRAYRAVAKAIAVNPIAYLIPCHRVISSSGKIHQYRWGSARKKALVGWEAARAGCKV